MHDPLQAHQQLENIHIASSGNNLLNNGKDNHLNVLSTPTKLRKVNNEMTMSSSRKATPSTQKSRRHFYMDDEQEHCQASVALLDSFQFSMDSSASGGTDGFNSMNSVFTALETELAHSSIAAKLKQLQRPTPSLMRPVSLNSVKDIGTLLGNAQESRFFEEVNDLLEGLQDSHLKFIS